MWYFLNFYFVIFKEAVFVAVFNAARLRFA